MHEIAYSVLPGELVFDVGAHTGDKSEWFLSRGARVVAVEPQPVNAEALRNRFAGNANITIVEKGLSERPGIMTMHVNAAASVLSTFSDKWMTGRFRDHGHVWDEDINVEMTTLDELVHCYGVPRYAKIDVEGHEKQVMLGLSRRLGALSLEFTREFIDDARDLIWYARALGYKNFNLSLGESDDFALQTWASADGLIEKLQAVCAGDTDAWGDIYCF